MFNDNINIDLDIDLSYYASSSCNYYTFDKYNTLTIDKPRFPISLVNFNIRSFLGNYTTNYEAMLVAMEKFMIF